MLNMLTFIVFSVCHSLGQSLRGIALPSQYFELYHRNIAFPRNFLIKYVLFVLFFSHKFYLYRFVLNFVFVAVVFVYLTIFFLSKRNLSYYFPVCTFSVYKFVCLIFDIFFLCQMNKTTSLLINIFRTI